MTVHSLERSHRAGAFASATADTFTFVRSRRNDREPLVVVDECSLQVYADRNLTAEQVEQLRRRVRRKLARAARRLTREGRVVVRL